MRILIVADEENPALWDHYQPGKLDGLDLILSAGDLSAEYLSFLVTMANCPLLYIHGNHDAGYAHRPPEGCLCIEDRLVTVAGLRILGLGGCPVYNHGPHQYTEGQMRRRILRLWPALRRAGGVDLILTHAPARHYGDLEDPAHRGFTCFLSLLDRYHPRYLIHGHIHDRYQSTRKKEFCHGETIILNGTGVRYLEI